MELARDLEYENYANGKGIRMVLWNQGCNLHCPGCHNQQTWIRGEGYWRSIEKVKEDIFKHQPGHRGITLTGGDPFLQPYDNAEIARFCHSLGLDVWAYCGLTFEQIKQDPNMNVLLQECDVLVDGPFILAQRDITLPFRGSANQRVIDVKKSLETNSIVLYC